MKTKRRSKILSLILSVCMMLTMMPMTILAEGNTITGKMEIGGTTVVEDLSKDGSGVGWTWTAETDTLKLTDDITGNILFTADSSDVNLSVNLAVYGERTITGNFQQGIGKLKISGDSLTVSLSGSNTSALWGKGGLEIEDASVNVNTSETLANAVWVNEGDLTMSSGSLTVTANGDYSDGIVIDGNGGINISGTANVSANVTGEYGQGICAPNITVDGGSLAGTSSQYIGISAHKSLTIKGGTVTAKGTDHMYGAVFSQDGNINVTGGSLIVGDSDGANGDVVTTKILSISGESSIVTVNGGVKKYYSDGGDLTVSAGTVTIAGRVEGRTIHTGGMLNGNSPGPIPTMDTISGTIKGSDTNSGIDGATVQLKNAGGLLAGTTTNSTGQYIFSYLEEGTYSIEASANGYNSATINDIALGTASITDQDLTLTRQDYYGTYGLIVGDIVVTDENKNNITGIGITGKISYDPTTKTLTMENAIIGFTNFNPIVSTEDLTVKLEGNSVLGVEWSDYQQSQIGVGISGDKNITLTGDGNLTIYNNESGIQAKNITIDMGGSLTIDELGSSGLACTLKANGGTITINKGTLKLSSRLSNGLYASNIVINGGSITAYSKNENNAGLFAFNRAPSFSRDYWYKVYAGNDEATAVDITAPNSRTYTNSKYVRIEQSPEGTGLRGGDRDNGGGSGGNGGGSGSGSYTPPTPTTPSTPKPTVPDTKPGEAVTAVVPVTAIGGANSTASASIPDKTVKDAIAAAEKAAKDREKTEDGIALALEVNMPQGATSLTATLAENSLKSLVSTGVNKLEISGTPVVLSFNLGALQSIQSQASGGITIGINPVTELSVSGQSMIGNRPVYSITISYTDKDGNSQNITNFGRGEANLAIPYTPTINEAHGYLFGVYVDDNGNASRINDSFYDANEGTIIIPTDHLSIYGVGYEEPSAKFTDIDNHWAKEAIDFVVGRGFLAGTSETTFAPDTAMTRGMLVTVLGRLAEVDAKTYEKNSFTDVANDKYYAPYIEWAYNKGIVKGIGNSQFAPDRAVTREEIAVIFANYTKATGYKLPITSDATTYADNNSIGHIYKGAVIAMQQAGIIIGDTNNNFNPKASATRAEVSAMLQRYIELGIEQTNE